MLTLDPNEAKRADNRSSVINTSGKYIGEITRAEKLKSTKGSEGLGLSFKSDSGASANYLDLYTVNAEGKKLPSRSIVDAILCCTKMRQVPEGEIEVEKWDAETKQTYKSKVHGYPTLMGKKVGLLLQEELSTNSNTGADVSRVVIYGVFDPETEFTASEILEKALKPEKLEKMVAYLASHPVNDRRVTKARPANASGAAKPAGNFDDFDDDIPF